MEKDFYDLSLVKELKARNSILLNNLEEVYKDTKTILNTRISFVFGTYTLHDINHSNRIMEYMYDFIDDINQLSDLEIGILCYSALLHDIGMAVWDNELESIKNDIYISSNGKFSPFLKYYEDENIAIQEFIRAIHAERSARYIKEKLSTSLHLPNQPTNSFTEEVAFICQSHTENIDWLQKKLSNHVVKGDFSFNPQYCASLLRMADILDIDTQRTPYRLYELIQPKGISNAEWRQHFVINNNKKIEIDNRTKIKKIVFYGSCDDPSIHRKVLQYLDWVQQELIDCIALTEKMDYKYILNFSSQIDNYIESKNYTFSNHKMLLNFRAISNLLMGKNIYGSESLGLREIIQNSIDACEIRKEETLRNSSFGDDPFISKIKIFVNKTAKNVVIKDNGIGMKLDTIKNHFLSIGTSYYLSRNFKLKDYNYQPIGNYGIGFLSCFMLSPTIRMSTRYYLSNDRFDVDLEKDSEYTSIAEREDVSFEGTEISLNYDTFMQAFDSEVKNIRNFIKKYFITDNINIELIDVDKSDRVNIENLLKDSSQMEEGTISMDISDYLYDIEGYISIKTNNKFIKDYRDVFDKKTYIYDEEIIVEVDESLDLRNYIDDNTINYLEIPIISSFYTSDYFEALDFYNNDHDKAIERLGHKISQINILLTKDQSEDINIGQLGMYDDLFTDFPFSNLEELGHDISCDIEVKYNKITVYHVPEIPEMIEYNPIDHSTRDLFNIFMFGRNHNGSINQRLYLRKVLIENFALSLPYTSNIFNLKGFKINITNSNIYPDISRNNLNSSIEGEFNYSLSKAIYLGVLKEANFSPTQKNLLKSFIKRHFNRTTRFEK